MKLGSSLLAALFTGNLVNAKYTVQVPDDAIWVTTWEQYHAEAPQFGKTVLYKYGGFVVEVDDKIVLATDEKMTKEIHDLLTELEENDAEPESEPQTPNRRDTEEFVLPTPIAMSVLGSPEGFLSEADAFELVLNLVDTWRE